MLRSKVKTEYSKYEVQLQWIPHTPSTAFTVYRIIPWSTVFQFLISWQTMLRSILYIPTISSQPKNRVPAPVSPPSRSTASRLTASKYSSDLARSRSPSTSSNLLESRVQVHFQSHWITASNFARSWPPRAYVQTHSNTASKCISKLTPLWPPSWHNHGLGVHL